MDPFNFVIGVRALLAIVLASGGIFALDRGFRLFQRKSGLAKAPSKFQLGNIRIDVKNVGAIVMITASFWGLLSLMSLPRIISPQMAVSGTAKRDNMQDLTLVATSSIIASQKSFYPTIALQEYLWQWANDLTLQDKNPDAIATEYDEEGRIQKLVIADMNLKFTYDPSGNMTSSETEIRGTKSKSTNYQYDPLGSRLIQSDSESITTKYEYDSGGNLVRAISQKKAPEPK